MKTWGNSSNPLPELLKQIQMPKMSFVLQSINLKWYVKKLIHAVPIINLNLNLNRLNAFAIYRLLMKGEIEEKLDILISNSTSGPNKHVHTLIYSKK